MFSNKNFPTPVYCRCSIKKKKKFCGQINLRNGVLECVSVFTTSPVSERYVDEIMDMK